MLMRQLQTPTGPNQNATKVAPISSGGTSATNKRDAVNNLGGISKDEYGQASGVVQLDAQGKIPAHLLPPLVDFRYGLFGPTVMAHEEQAEFFVTNFSHDKALSVSVSNGGSFVVRSKDTILVTAPNTGDEFKLTVNERSIIVKCSRPGPLKPSLEAITTEDNTKTFYSNPFRDGPRTYTDWVEVNASTPEFVVEEGVSDIWIKGQSYGTTGQVGAVINGTMHAVNDGDTIRSIAVIPGQRVAMKTTDGKPLAYRLVKNNIKHTNTYWQISKDRDFATVYKEKHATDDLRKWTVELDPGVYYMRFTHNVNTPGITNVWSDIYTVAMPTRTKTTTKPPFEFHSVIDLLPYHETDKNIVMDVDASGDYVIVGNPHNGPVLESNFKVYRRLASTWQYVDGIALKDMPLIVGPAKDPIYGYAKAVKISPDGRTVAILDTTVRTSANHVTNSNQEGLVYGSIYVCRVIGNEVVPEIALTGDELQACTTQPLLSADGNAVAFFANNTLHYYIHNGAQWMKLSEYTLPTLDAPWSVAASDDLSTITVGYMSSTKVIVLKKDTNNLYSMQQEISNGGATGTNFGYSLDISKDASILAVGSPVISNTVYGSGTAPVVDLYRFNGTQYEHFEQMPGTPGSMFGKSVSLNTDGKLIAVGSPNVGETAKFLAMVRCGAAFYKNTANGDNQVFRRDIEYPETEFGDLVCLNNMTLMVTSRKRGSIFVYRMTKHNDTFTP